MDGIPGSLESMNTHPSIRRFAWVFAFVSAFPWEFAHADIYTWVDAKGILNVSNRAPPEGARVTGIFREDPAVRASSEAARDAAQREELKALTERVKQLERDLEIASSPPPAPIANVSAAPVPAPIPYPSVVVQSIITPAPPAYASCTDPWWGSCFSPGYFGFYPGGVVVVNSAASHRFRPAHRGPRTPSRPFAQPFPQPVGALPDPVNLFPGSRRR
jgi:hypothetical protein